MNASELYGVRPPSAAPKHFHMRNIVEILKKITLILLLILPALIIQLTSKSPVVIKLTNFIQAYLLSYLLVLLFVKAISIVYPPLPGIAFTIASIPIIGWPLAYLVDIMGSTLGVIIAFFLGKSYGYSILLLIVGETIADKISKIKLKSKNQIESAIFLRFAATGMLSDALAWGASLIGFKFLPFTIGYLISHVISTLPVFYLVAISTSFNSWLIMLLAVAALTWFVIIKFKDRYFE